MTSKWCPHGCLWKGWFDFGASGGTVGVSICFCYSTIITKVIRICAKWLRKWPGIAKTGFRSNPEVLNKGGSNSESSHTSTNESGIRYHVSRTTYHVLGIEYQLSGVCVENWFHGFLTWVVTVNNNSTLSGPADCAKRLNKDIFGSMDRKFKIWI